MINDPAILALFSQPDPQSAPTLERGAFKIIKAIRDTPTGRVRDGSFDARYQKYRQARFPEQHRRAARRYMVPAAMRCRRGRVQITWRRAPALCEQSRCAFRRGQLLRRASETCAARDTCCCWRTTILRRQLISGGRSASHHSRQRLASAAFSVVHSGHVWNFARDAWQRPSCDEYRRRSPRRGRQ